MDGKGYYDRIRTKINSESYSMLGCNGLKPASYKDKKNVTAKLINDFIKSNPELLEEMRQKIMREV
jgi:hypothetical protein